MSPKVFVPRPVKSAVNYRPRQGCMLRSPIWKVPYDAIEEFLEFSSTAANALTGFPGAERLVSWLEKEVPVTVGEYLQWLNKCNDDMTAAVDCAKFLVEEGESVADLLDFLKDIESDIIFDVADDAPEKLKDGLWAFLEEKIDPVRKAGWHMYHVFIHAV